MDFLKFLQTLLPSMQAIRIGQTFMSLPQSTPQNWFFVICLRMNHPQNTKKTLTDGYELGLNAAISS